MVDIVERLNGMGASREAALMAKLEAAEKERDALRTELADLRSSMTFRASLIGRIEAERDELRAKVEAMKGCLPYGAIAKILTEVMDIATANGADSRSMPDEYVEVAAWLCGVPGAQPAPSLASGDVSLMDEGKTQPAQSVKDDIIDDLQSQFDTEGITEHDSGCALIRLSDAIAAVEDNFAQPAPIEQDTSVRNAWARFSNELHRSPDAPYPGMSEAFEQHFSQSFTDRDWRAESSTWAAAWKAAKRHEAQAQPAQSIPEGWLRAIDEALVVAHIGIANESDTYEQAKAKLDNLIGFHVDVATDPAVNGGWKLVPIEPTETFYQCFSAYDGTSYSNPFDYDDFVKDWREALAAAPEAKP